MRPSGSNKKLVLKASTNHRRRNDSGIFRINPEMSRCVTQKHSYQILNGPAANWDDFYHVNVEKRPKHLDKCFHVFV